MSKIHAMLDLETLGQGSNAFILQICLTTFSLDDPNYQSGTFVETIDSERMQVGSEIDRNTERWWERQDPEVRAKVMGGTTRLTQALINLMEWVDNRDKIDYLWANSPSFDCVILDNACKRNAVENKLPKYFNWLDMRTVMTIANLNGAKIPKPPNNHDAEQDVSNQIEHLKLALSFLNQRG